MEMKVRDGFASINGDKTEHILPSGEVVIIGDDGKSLFDIKLKEDGSIEISAGIITNHQGVMLDDVLTIEPRDARRITVKRPEYQGD